MNEETLDSPSQPPLRHPALNMPESPLLIVGIGGAAGSLDALRDFLAALSQVQVMDEPTGLAIMLAVEPDPAQVAALVDYVRAISSLQVTLLQHGERLQAERVYVVPADAAIAFDSAHAVQLARQGAGEPVDRLFQALSQT
ncbi:MAG TPA: chemotaxis protein CheB, partial [Polyangiales bacterium]|nr:chemotaxis protein CheB [Polyangiales bacterium]